MSTWSNCCRQATPGQRLAMYQGTTQQPPHQGRAEKGQTCSFHALNDRPLPNRKLACTAMGLLMPLQTPGPHQPVPLCNEEASDRAPCSSSRRAPYDCIHVTFTSIVHLKLPLPNEEAAPAKEVPLLQLRQQLAGHHCALAGGGTVAPQGAHHAPISQLHLQGRVAVESSSLLLQTLSACWQWPHGAPCICYNSIGAQGASHYLAIPTCRQDCTYVQPCSVQQSRAECAGAPCPAWA